jgi:hypothetical protein
MRRRQVPRPQPDRALILTPILTDCSKLTIRPLCSIQPQTAVE